MPKDQPFTARVTERKTVFSGMIWDVVSETFDFADQSVTRQFVVHPGAVAVLAINAQDEVLLIRQYRHPVRGFLWEIPAGLLDVEGESHEAAAKRELLEETGYATNQLSQLLDFYTTPGGNNEMIRIFLASDLHLLGRPDEAEGEERELISEWVPFSEALDSVLAGEIKSPSAVVGILAAAQKRRH